MKGSIQIWDIGVVSVATNALPTPHLSLTVAHEFGVVREMKWCPSGCYEEVRAERGEEEGGSMGGGEGVREGGSEGEREDRLPKLGLLAVASSDGFTRILRYICQSVDSGIFLKGVPCQLQQLDTDIYAKQNVHVHVHGA